MNYGNLPGLLFHASFDAAGHDDLKPVADSPIHATFGREGWYPNADFSKGSPIPIVVNDARVVTGEGKFGDAVFLPGGPRGGLLSFEADRNVQTRSGTIAFWAKAELPADKWRGRVTLLAIPSIHFPVRYPHKDFLWMRPIPDQNEVSVLVRDRTQSKTLSFNPGEDYWEQPAWHHYGITWDSASGWTLYFDGEKVAESETTLHTFPVLRKIALGNEARTRPRSQSNGFYYDNLWIFDYPLHGDQIRELMASNRPPVEAPAPYREAEGEWISREFAFELDSMPVWEGGVLVAKQVAVSRALAETIDTRMPMDGKLLTTWPLERKGFGESELTLIFDTDQPLNYVRLMGDLEGNLAFDGEIVATFDGSPFIQRTVLPPGTRTGKSGMLAVAKEPDNSGSVSQLDFYDISKEPNFPTADWRMVFSLSEWPVPADELGEPGVRIAAYYPRWEQDAFMLLNSHEAEARGNGFSTQEIEPFKTYHIVSMPMEEDSAVDRLDFELQLKDFSEPTPVAIRIWDTSTYSALLGEFDFVIPALKDETVRLSWDLQGFLIESGQRMWMTITFGGAGKINVGADASTIAMYGDIEKVRPGYLAAQETILANLFEIVSEQRPWHTRRGDPRRQERTVDELLTRAEHLMHFDALNPTGVAIYVWITRFASPGYWVEETHGKYPDPLEDVAVDLPDLDAPEWAVYGCEALKLLRKHPLWWARNRQNKEGLFGSGYWDDTCLINDWVNFILIGDPGNELRDSYIRLADWTWENALTEGISRKQRDLNHTYEEGTMIQTPLAIIDYGNPEYIERLMTISRYYDGHMTAINDKGMRLWRSHYFSGTEHRTDPHFAYDTGAALMFYPGRMLVWYNGNPEVLSVLREWQDTWLEQTADGPARDYFGPALDFETGMPTKSRDRFALQGNTTMWEHLYWLHRKTGDDRYVEPVLTNLRAGVLPNNLKPWLWIQWRKEYPDDEADRGLLSILKDADSDLDLDVGEDDRDTALLTKVPGSTGFVNWQLTGDRSHLINGLKEEISYMQRFLPMHTWIGQSTDRVAISQYNLSAMFLGGSANAAKKAPYHFHAVSWEGADDDIARFVVEDHPDRLKVLLYSFHEEKTVDVMMRVWKLQHGMYRVQIGIDDEGDEVIDRAIKDIEKELFRYESISVPVPSRKVVVVTVDQIKKLDGIRNRPDLAVESSGLVMENGGVRATVHNIGALPAPETEIQLLLNGNVVASELLPPMEAPVNLQPSISEIKIPWSGNIGENAMLEVVVDPDGVVDEITTANNRAAFTQ